MSSSEEVAARPTRRRQTDWEWRQKVKRADARRREGRYFVYWLYDAEGNCLYIGRSKNVYARLRAHYSASQRPEWCSSSGSFWFPQVRSLDMDGPYTWNDAVRREAAAIRFVQPPYNIVHTDRFPEVLAKRERAS